MKQVFDIKACEAVLEQVFADWVLRLKPVLEIVSAERLVMRIPFSDDLCRHGGIMCGQALISAADTAMVLAIAARIGSLPEMTTLELKCNFLRPVVDEDALLDVEVVRIGKRISFCTAQLSGSKNKKPVAFATGTFAML